MLRFEHWSPRTGCREEEEQSNEVWVRIFGLPVSLWNPTVLSRVGDECGGFIAIDPQTAKLEELQWARILVKMDGEVKPCMLEIGVEEEVYALVLWWELRSSVKKTRVDSRKSGEVRGDDFSHDGSPVEEESTFERPKALLLSDEGMGMQERGLGREVIVDRAQESATMGSLKRACGPRLQSESMGLKLKGVVTECVGSEAGPSKRWAFDGAGPTSALDGARPVKPMAQELVFEWPEVLMLSDKGMGVQEKGLGWDGIADRAQESVT